MGYTHVYLKKDQHFHCAIGSNCIRFKVTVSKKTVTSSLCPHEHIATILSGNHLISNEILPESVYVIEPIVRFTESERMTKTSEYILKNKKLDLSKAQKKIVEAKLKRLNQDGWPKTFEPLEENCPNCSEALEPPVKHQGMYT